MKTLILARHGQTSQNNQNIFQSDSELLNELGVFQAHKLAIQLQKEPIELILYSQLPRTVQTARIINEQLKLPVKALNLLVEFKNPPAIRGKSYNDPVADEMYQAWVDKLTLPTSLNNPEEENYIDLHIRAGKLLEYIKARPEQCILGISHSAPIRAVMAYILLGENPTPQKISDTIRSLKIDNAETVRFTYNPDADFWRIVV